jgi:predicted restriction endonuclease
MLAKEWGVPALHSCYRKDGTWYHCLERFPGALFDENGYVLFETKQDYESCPDLIIEYEKNWSNIKRGGRLANLPGYTTFEQRLFATNSEEPLAHEGKVELWEGGKTRVVVNRYERDALARKQCIEIFGAKCSVCGFDFLKRYGDIGKGFIHVHHLKPLSMIKKEYRVNPRDDLRPVCPNCHEMLHTRNPEPLSIQELQALLLPENRLP